MTEYVGRRSNPVLPDFVAVWIFSDRAYLSAIRLWLIVYLEWRPKKEKNCRLTYENPFSHKSVICLGWGTILGEDGGIETELTRP